jgi:SRSO17 transposase
MGMFERFEQYMESLADGLAHADRRAGLKGYCAGLMLPLSRKSVEPIAARIDPQHVSARHQSLHHFVAKSQWSDQALLTRVRERVQPLLGTEGGLYWIIDDTGFPKKGTHSVGVARQYCGQLGKQDNCQVAVSLSLASPRASVPIAYRLYLPQRWAEDAPRRAQAQVPQDIEFATKPAIALGQVREAIAQGVPPGIVLADAGYGDETAFREELTRLGLIYAVGVRPGTTVWPPGLEPLAPMAWSGRGRHPRLLRRAPGHAPTTVKALAMSLPPEAYQTVDWREGTNETLRSRFARVRVRAAHRDYWRGTPRPQEWLLIEWPEGEAEPLKYFLSTAPAQATTEQMVFVSKMRWRIERDYQELKQEFGLGHYEGRGWVGFHHHATLAIAVYGFLVAERLRTGRDVKKNTFERQAPAVSKDYVPRGTPAGAAPCIGLDHDTTHSADLLPDPPHGRMSALRRIKCTTHFLTQ